MSKQDMPLDEFSDITAYENYITAIRDTVTKKKYAGQMEMFLNPDYDWSKSQQKRKLLPEKKFMVLINDFADFIIKDPNAELCFLIPLYIVSLKINQTANFDPSLVLMNYQSSNCISSP